MWPRANGLTERFMKNINKVIRTAIAENKNWREQLRHMLINYRTSPHAVTGITPSELFFNRKVRGYVPDAYRQQSPYFDKVKMNQEQQHEKAAKHYPRSKEVILKVGDKVLMMRDQKKSKFDTSFYNSEFIVVAIKDTMVTVESESGRRYARNVSFFKLLKGKGKEDTIQQKGKVKPPVKRTERKSYPKRVRKPIYQMN